MNKSFSGRSEAETELRSPEAEIFSSLGKRVGKEKKWIKKKGTTTTTGTTFFAPPLISLANFKKSVSF
jgi:hypothetical protein